MTMDSLKPIRDLAMHYLACAAHASRAMQDVEAEAARLEREGSADDAAFALRFTAILRTAVVGWDAKAQRWFTSSEGVTISCPDTPPQT